MYKTNGYRSLWSTLFSDKDICFRSVSGVPRASPFQSLPGSEPAASKEESKESKESKDEVVEVEEKEKAPPVVKMEKDCTVGFSRFHLWAVKSGRICWMTIGGFHKWVPPNGWL